MVETGIAFCHGGTVLQEPRRSLNYPSIAKAKKATFPDLLELTPGRPRLIGTHDFERA
jgi:hypothetical protein